MKYIQQSFLILFFGCLIANTCHPMELVESKEQTTNAKTAIERNPDGNFYTFDFDMQPNKGITRTLYNGIETLFLPVEIALKGTDEINKLRYGHEPIDSELDSHIKNVLDEESSLGDKARTLSLYKSDVSITNNENPFYSSMTGSTWVDLAKYNGLSAEQKHWYIKHEGNYIHKKGPLIQTVVPATLAGVLIYCGGKYITKHYGLHIAYAGSNRILQKTVGIISLGILSSQIAKKVVKKPLEIGLEKYIMDPIIENHIHFSTGNESNHIFHKQ
jgi:hypothetical protein